jgi:hypothetical protein
VDAGRVLPIPLVGLFPHRNTPALPVRSTEGYSPGLLQQDEERLRDIARDFVRSVADVYLGVRRGVYLSLAWHLDDAG